MAGAFLTYEQRGCAQKAQPYKYRCRVACFSNSNHLGSLFDIFHKWELTVQALLYPLSPIKKIGVPIHYQLAKTIFSNEKHINSFLLQNTEEDIRKMSNSKPTIHENYC